MLDLSSWDFALTFTALEVAYLIRGIDPSGAEASKYRPSHIQERLASAYSEGIEKANHLSDLESFFSSQSESDVPEHAVLRSISLLEQLKRYQDSGDIVSVWRWLDDGDRSFANQKFSRDEINRWLKENNLKSVYQFDAESCIPSDANGDKNDTPSVEKKLANRERDTLLTIIAILCREAKLDYTKAAKTAGLIVDTAAGMQISIGETTIENHLKRIPDALRTRTR